jgi:hypothetical protein
MIMILVNSNIVNILYHKKIYLSNFHYLFFSKFLLLQTSPVIHRSILPSGNCQSLLSASLGVDILLITA